MTVVAIHQPNLLPWLGFFEKADRADVFVLLDEVQLPRRSATTRVGILLQGERRMLTLPVRHTGTQALRICDASVDVDNPLLRKGAATLERAYGHCPWWPSIGPSVVAVLADPPERLLDLNLRLIELTADALGVDLAHVRFQSELGGGTGQKSQLMASLTHAAGGDVYLSGGSDPLLAAHEHSSGADYNDPAVYASYGVEVRYQDFTHPTYDQGTTEFVPGLSAVDALTRLGPDAIAVTRRVNADGRAATRSRARGETVRA